jgi:outer membrane lipoprotein carrier protein
MSAAGARLFPVALCLCLLPSAPSPVGAQTATRSAQQLAQELQTKYDGIRDFTADFVHAYEGGALRKQITERGHLIIKKPGKMRWDYAAPDQKVFVSDGLKMYSYIPQDKQVIVSSVPQDDQAATPTLFLAGKGSLVRDFTPSLVPVPKGLPADSLALKLVPKTPQREYDWLVLVVDPSTLDFRGLVTVDAQGGISTFSFANLKVNTNPADKEFAFKIPRGVDVVSATSR